MNSVQEFLQQIPFVLDRSDFSRLGERYQGKVRDTYTRNGKRLLVTTDRLSCFDVVVTTIPWKGMVLNQLAQFWLNKTSSIIQNHMIAAPHPHIMVAHDCAVIPIEVVVRGYLTGSAWRAYRHGNTVSGVSLPAGMKEFEKFPQPLLTPSTKAPLGSHDEPISESEIVTQGIVDSTLWNEIRKTAISLFEFATREVAQRGLILVDTKFEFGLHHGKLILVDEIFTLDSSRYWLAESYLEGQTPVMLDKEPVRQWLLKQGYQGEGKIPTFTDDYRVEIAQHYAAAFEKISGLPFHGVVGDVKNDLERFFQDFTL